MKFSHALLGAVVALVVGCSSDPAGHDAASDVDFTSTHTRDWTKNPAIVDIQEADEIYALSDPHGGYEQLGRLLEVNGVIASFSSDPSQAAKAKWTAGTAMLVVAGDMIDKGVESIGVIDLLRSLQGKASAAGGRVIVTMGNHEAEFLADPGNDKANASKSDDVGINVELREKGIDPKVLAEGRDAEGRGAWLLSLPFGVRIKKWFFSHAGNTDGDSLDELSKRLEHAVKKDGYDAKDITGDKSILQAQQWYGNPKKDNTAKKNADALDVKHIVFGHDPGALDDRGKIITAADDVLVKLDVNMGLAGEKQATVGGLLLHITTKGTDTAEVLDDGASEKSLF